MTDIPPRSAPDPVVDLPGEAGRVALLSDIHGNLPALEAVLAEVDAEGVEAVCLLGDTTWGPQPHGAAGLAAVAGSVGLGYGIRAGNAQWALLDGDRLQLRTTRYDLDAALEALRAVDYPIIEGLSEMLRHPVGIAEVEADAIERGGFSD